MWRCDDLQLHSKPDVFTSSCHQSETFLTNPTVFVGFILAFFIDFVHYKKLINCSPKLRFILSSAMT